MKTKKLKSRKLKSRKLKLIKLKLSGGSGKGKTHKKGTSRTPSTKSASSTKPAPPSTKPAPPSTKPAPPSTKSALSTIPGPIKRLVTEGSSIDIYGKKVLDGAFGRIAKHMRNRRRGFPITNVPLFEDFGYRRNTVGLYLWYNSDIGPFSNIHITKHIGHSETTTDGAFHFKFNYNRNVYAYRIYFFTNSVSRDDFYDDNNSSADHVPLIKYHELFLIHYNNEDSIFNDPSAPPDIADHIDVYKDLIFKFTYLLQEEFKRNFGVKPPVPPEKKPDVTSFLDFPTLSSSTKK